MIRERNTSNSLLESRRVTWCKIRHRDHINANEHPLGYQRDFRSNAEIENASLDLH